MRRNPNHKELDEKPPWLARNMRERRWMHEWVCSKLEDFAERTEWRGSRVDELYERALEAFEEEGEAVRWAAEYADLAPLRRMFPKHAKYINFPKLLGQGKRPKRKAKDKLPIDDPWDPRLRLAIAVAEVSFIRSIWRDHYKQRNRPKGQLRAEEIAATRWDLDEDEVVNRRLSRERLGQLPRQ